MKDEMLRMVAVVMGFVLLGCSQPEETTTPGGESVAVGAGAVQGDAETAKEPDLVPVEPDAVKEGLQLELPGFADGGTIPDSMAFCVPAAEGHVTLGSNQSPEMKWSQVPEGTKSFVVICHDSEAPGIGDDVNKEGRTVAKDLARTDFYHWVMADMTPGLRGLSAGQDSDKVTSGGKAPGPTDYGSRGINEFTVWFAGDEKMRGEYGGYDGPCPPWNDERMHVYHFTVYALSVESLKMDGSFTAPQVLAVLEGKVLDKATWSGTYTLNKALRSGAASAPAVVPAASAADPAAGGDPG